MIARAVIFFLALICFALSTMDVKPSRGNVNVQSLGLLLLTAALLSEAWSGR